MILVLMLFILIFFLIAGVFIVSLAQGIGRWNQDNHSSRLTPEEQKNRCHDSTGGNDES